MRNNKKLLLSALTILTVFSALSMATKAADVTVQINQIEKNQGHLLVSIFAGKENYNANKAKSSLMVKVSKKSHSIIFKNIPNGSYAIKLYHDENDNKKLDMNLFGIPSEGYGFSNNVGAYGPANFKDASFNITHNKTLKIDLL